MVAVTRRSFMQAVALTPTSLSMPNIARGASAAKYRYKFGHGFSLTHPIHLAAVAAAEQTMKETDGAVQVQVHGAGQLGGDSHMLSQVRDGSLELFLTAGFVIGTLVPAASIFAIGFAFKDYATVWNAVDGDLGKHVHSAIAAAGLDTFGTTWDNGFRQISAAARPVKEVSDLRGMKLRVPVSPVMSSMFRALGASPVTLNFSDLYMALQSRLVDGQENTLAVFETGRLHEVQKYITNTNHVWDGCWVLANRSALSAMDADSRKVLVRSFNENGLKQRAASAEMASKLQGELTAKGINFVETNIDPFREALKQSGYYNEWRQKLGSDIWSLLAKHSPDLA